MIVKGFIHINDKYFTIIDEHEYVGRCDEFDLIHLINLTNNNGENIEKENRVEVNLMVVWPKEFLITFPMEKSHLPNFWKKLKS